ncbi:DNA polymerase III subunit gamma and tau [Cryobacterium sp. TMS1-20-1]|uniref:DNA polymerase III subunit gamma and tau n=1 Tax=Cryobacterium sp. TMS1-20-1 TaxID=1259223 RepID=UPI00106AF980|nr:DNA polymerase III subunit gamma and tau [Cryobacterium sp. TMS1-20-1]TFC76721.1 DNA polymerase III subunit gamma and tau [Cryobacterium sp. TMS1-20-1]
MVTALYRRYRPETFAEMIGQSQVTDPLMTALRTNRVNHAYLFSGPRGCGKTTSARILARCLNCAEGPTDTPCGVCPSCVELARDGGGSLDVVEIDAASHNGVDDARDIRERAIFAPARDRYKIFILDEAHMVTPQGFNALLKIVEEPPEHVKFIFATTEPEKVIGTIRSRTHHYPFRLVPPGPMLEYVQQMCDVEKMVVAPGVLPLVVRAGGGSPRDTLSLLDQLMAGADGQSIEYERAVALLGYTSASLLDEAVDAIGARDSAAAFDAVDRVIQTGQDPRRFVEDLLERMRDLIIVAATSVAGAAAVLRGVPQDELERMSVQASAFGPAELSRTADILNAALTEMSGATSPRLHLELMIARALIPATDDTTRGALARVERLERRIGVDGVGASAPAPRSASGDLGKLDQRVGAPVAPAAAPQAGGVAAPGAQSPSAPGSATPAASAPGATSAARANSATPPAPLVQPVETAIPGTQGASAASPSSAGPASSSGSAPSAGAAPSSSSTPGSSSAASGAPVTSAASPSPLVEISTGSIQGLPNETAIPGAQTARPAVVPGAPVSLQQLKDAWPEILEAVKTEKTTAWLVVYTAHVLSLNGDVLALSFPSVADVDSFKQQKVPGMGTSDFLRTAIVAVLGLRVKFIARVDAGREMSSPSASSGDSTTVAAEPAPAVPAPKPPATSVPTTSVPAASVPAALGADSVSSASPGSTENAADTAESALTDPASTEAAQVRSPASAPATSAPSASASGAPGPATPTAALAALAARATAATAAPAAAPASTPAGASAVAASTSGWATVAIPGSPNGPALPAVVDDTTDAPAPASPAAPISDVPDAASVSASSSSSTPVSAPSSLADSASPRRDEPPFDDAPPPFDDDDAPPEMDAPAEERVPDYGADAEASASQLTSGQPSSAGQQDSRRSGQQNAAHAPGQQPSGQQGQQIPGQPNDQRNAGQPSDQQNRGQQSAPAQRQHPNASGQRGAAKDPSRAPSFAEKQRYGEAVVREILGATFIEEQPYTAAPRTRNDH